jgi:hypothetical protein
MPERSSTTLNSISVGAPWRSGSSHGGEASSLRSDGLMSKCHSAFENSAWNRIAGGSRVMRDRS